MKATMSVKLKQLQHVKLSAELPLCLKGELCLKGIQHQHEGWLNASVKPKNPRLMTIM